MATHGDIARDLVELGLAEGDLVMVHASLRAVGPIDDGADSLIEAIQSVVGSQGTMVMVLGATDDWAWVNEKPEAARAALLADALPFDASTTPAHPDVGVLAEVFRRRAEVKVSNHPEGRFAAAGRLADDLLVDVPWNDYYGPGSPLERMTEAGVRVLRMGADLNTVTLLHLSEARADLAEKRRVRRHRLLSTPTGSEIRVVETWDDEDGVVDYEGDDYFAVILRQFMATKPVLTGWVGSAHSELIDGSALVDFGVKWMETNL